MLSSYCIALFARDFINHAIDEMNESMCLFRRVLLFLPRIHSQATGRPILGDSLYADEAVRGASDRLMLHAHQLILNHPRTRKRLAFTALSKLVVDNAT